MSDRNSVGNWMRLDSQLKIDKCWTGAEMTSQECCLEH
jgi:hypothetical protein